MSKTAWLAAVAWLLAAAGIYYVVDGRMNPNRNPGSQGGEVTLQRGMDGHYRATALINGEKVDVLVDTGATGVAISSRTAERLGLSSHVAARTTTANGDAVAYVTRLRSVKIGEVEAHDVAAMITPGLQGEALLGMSFLSRMDVRLFRGKMTIKQGDEAISAPTAGDF
ncbi:retroviral-like aspartic protease family protein [Methylovorus menthalis]|uniref:retropepsin-like aspartic protease family protein n=1 Tax=Methylovorus menthalis TaxID=1002227 RepID=UPI001E58FB45|nr:retropepsin-like aspartic protease [Methylovorus menthalis]MCB4812292.1 retroviral-like aspartic protease family protein [Methylovorus menthalis]